MIAPRIPGEKDLHEVLEEKGFERTSERTGTGTFWRSKTTGKHVLIPDSDEGLYPSSLLMDIEEQIGKLNLWPLVGPKRNH